MCCGESKRRQLRSRIAASAKIRSALFLAPFVSTLRQLQLEKKQDSLVATVSIVASERILRVHRMTSAPCGGIWEVAGSGPPTKPGDWVRREVIEAQPPAEDNYEALSRQRVVSFFDDFSAVHQNRGKMQSYFLTWALS